MSDVDDPLEALARLPTMAHPTAAPGGNRIAMYYDVSGRNELHVVDSASGDREQWSAGNVPRNARWFVRWGADGDRVFVHRDDAGNEQNDIHAIHPDGSDEVILEEEGQNVIHDVGDDGETLLFGSNRGGQMNVFRHDLSTGETARLTEYDRAVWSSVCDPDCERIAYSTNETDDFDNRDVYVAAIDGSDPRNLELGEVGAESGPVDWGPDGDRVLVSDNTPDLGRVGLVTVETGEVTWYGDGEFEETPVAVLPDGERVLATRVRGPNTVPVVYDVKTGEGRELDLPEGVASFGEGSNVVLTDDRLLLMHTTPTRRPELLAYDLAADEYETLVAADHGPFVPETPAEAVDHDPAETLDIGALFYDSGERPSPLVVNPHGGPRGRNEKRFDLYTQVLAMQGYSVLQVNYRGSTGRGREFVERLIGDWGGTEQGDIATAAESVLDRYDWLDDDRVAVFGGSFGGYSAYWQLLQYPALYDAGVAWIGVTDLEDMFDNTMPHFRTELMEKYLDTPDENPVLYEERSPVTHVENLAAPLLMVHGVNDRRVPVSQARIFRDALEEAGYEEGEASETSRADGEPADTDFEYEELGEEGHASTDQDQKLRMFRLLDEFLERRLTD
jgi:dipeptidyl aminopeptidase/acylaminoacyl peptidase